MNYLGTSGERITPHTLNAVADSDRGQPGATGECIRRDRFDVVADRYSRQIGTIGKDGTISPSRLGAVGGVPYD